MVVKLTSQSEIQANDPARPRCGDFEKETLNSLFLDRFYLFLGHAYLKKGGVFPF